MSAAVQARPTPPAASGASRGSAIDVDEPIDVDAFDDDVVFMGVNPAPVSFQNGVLVVSDDEDEPRAGPSNRRQLFSPPPPPQHRAIPPVPRLPAHLQTHASLPRPPPQQRPRFPRFPEGIIRPTDEQMTWERILPDPPRQRLAHVEPPLRAAPSSHHQPAMGLGGAILAVNDGPRRGRWPRNHNADDNWGMRNEDDPPRRMFHWADRLQHFLDHAYERVMGPGHRQNVPEANFADGVDDAAIHRMLAQEGDFANMGPLGYGVFRNGVAPELREPDYKAAYTHPTPAPPGFTHDFEPPSTPATIVIDDSPNSSRSAANPISKSETRLVCAKCMQPLLAEGGGTSDEAEQHANRVWALRCGHMLDGRCIEELSQPQEPTALAGVEEDRKPDVKRDVKGKGKARQVTESEDELLLKGPRVRGRRRGARRGNGSEGQASDIPPEMDDVSDIRSRLRSRGSTASHVKPEAPPPPAPLPQKRGRSTKGKGRARFVEEQYDWDCPVCARVHTSVKTDGPWTQDKNKGAIALYV